MPTCKYEGCSQRAYGDLPRCILHLDFPSEDAAEFDEIQRQKQRETQRRVTEGRFDFQGAKIYGVNASKVYGIWIGRRGITNVDFYDATVKGNVQFDDAVIKEDAIFLSATIEGDVLFGGATIEGEVSFDSANLEGSVFFEDATLGNSISFAQAAIKNGVSFRRAVIKEDAWFAPSRIGTCLAFNNATVGGRATFTGAAVAGECWFDSAEFGEEASFDFAAVPGLLSFKDTVFTLDAAEESACRAAKQNCERRGAKEEASDYFYREMKARRRQKKQPVKCLELVVQYGLGYGARPSWLLGWWLLIAFIGAIALGLASTQSQNFFDGFAAAFVPGYGITLPFTGIAKGVAASITVINFFLWAAFLAVFSRKYID